MYVLHKKEGCLTHNSNRTFAEISSSALENNFRIIKSTCSPAKICAVIKADAYGHGVDNVLPVLEECGADCYAVSNIDEAKEVRAYTKRPVIILGYTPCCLAKELFDYDIIQAVYSYDYAKELFSFAKKAKVTVKAHIKIDSGMCRLGFDYRNALCKGKADLIKTLSLDNFEFCGIFTHFSSADKAADKDNSFTNAQYERFIIAVETAKKYSDTINTVHCSNSAAILFDKDKHLNMCRAGIILYGLMPDSSIKNDFSLVPVMDFKSSVSLVKTIEAGAEISYSRRFKAEKEMKVATISVGYADGYHRALSNKGYVLIKGKKTPILGSICMDQMVVDISDIENVKIGDEVLLFGKELPAETVADIAGTINYELVCSVSKRVPRILK